MKKLYPVSTIILAGSLLLQLNIFCLHSRGAAGDVDLSFDPGFGVDGTVYEVVVQPDGKVLLGGDFTTVKGLVRTNIARLNADGSGDSSFVPAPMYYPVSSLALQSDGKVLVGSSGQDIDGPTVGFIRLNSDGSPDTNFNANADGAIGPAIISSILVQPDGKILFVADESLFRFNSNGTRDTSFTLDASFTGLGGHVYSMALQTDGKVIVGGYDLNPSLNYDYLLLRLSPNGSIDNTFNSAVSNSYFLSIVLQPDGKVLIGGYPFSGNGTNLTSVVRLNSNGSVDPAFFNQGAGAGSVVDRMALQPDGKVIIGGVFVPINGESRRNLARLNANGSLDGSFNPGTGANGGVSSIALQSDGRLLIGGPFTAFNGTNRNQIARLNADGSLDAAFQPGQGVDLHPISALVVQPDGKVLVGGVFTFINGTNRYASARLNTDGSRDETFTAATNFNPQLLAVKHFDDCFSGNCDLFAWATAAAVQADGKVLVGGVVRTEFLYGDEYLHYDRAILGRFYADGGLDTNFAPVFGGGYLDYVQFRGVDKVIVQPDGKILVAGTFPSVNGTNRGGIARLHSDGTLDNTFNAGTNYDYPASMALQSDGKVFIGGSSNSTNRVARLNADGSPDGSFNPGAGANGFVASIVVQADGKALIGGNFTTVNGANRNRVARLNANGSLDSGFNPGTGADGWVRSIALQSDGNVLIGGDFLTVNGVWRPHVARLYGDSAPSMSIARSNAFVILSWPVTVLNFQLQESTDLSLPNSWSSVAQSAATNGNQVTVTVPTTTGRKFFRLQAQ